MYDSKNRLIELHAGGEVTRYEYDPYDYRIAQETNGEKTLYYLDGEHIESIYDSRDKPLATFLRGAVIDEIIGAYYDDDHGKREFYTYFHDGVTSVTALANHTGAIQQTYEYSPFGQDRGSTGSTPNRLKYTGREQDSSGLYYYRARYYDPETRRFVTEDPIGFDGGINFYAYSGNNPITSNDPSGKLCFNCATAVIGLVSGGVGNAFGQVARNGGFSNFSVAEFGIAAGVGFVAGAVAPTTLLSAVLTGSGANLAQYGITQAATGGEITA